MKNKKLRHGEFCCTKYLYALVLLVSPVFFETTPKLKESKTLKFNNQKSRMGILSTAKTYDCCEVQLLALLQKKGCLRPKKEK
ncbi:MAG: hypothetical protein LBR17_01260 [Bacteroidales bacterium]|nr:hypothetical protein [Bacteroidales bacterium]